MVRRGCTVSLLLALVLFGAYFAFFTRYFEWPGNLFAAGLGSVFGFALLGAAGNALWGWRDFRAFRAAARREPPASGFTVVAGPVVPLGSALTSPFGAESCVAYEYEVTNPNRARNRSSPDHELTGFAMAAAAIETPHGSVRLLGFPLLSDFPQIRRNEASARARAAAYAASAPLEVMEGIGKLRLFAEMDDALVDDDGVVRKDFKLTSNPIPFQHRALAERIVRVRQPVCAAGVYDAELRALKPRGTTLNRLWPGELRTVQRQVASAMRRQVLTGIVLFLVSHTMLGIAWYLSETRHRREAPAEQAQILLRAVGAGDIVALERAVRRGADPNARDQYGTPVLMNVRDPALAETLIRLGAEVDIRDSESGDTPLIHASRTGFLPLVKVLLEAGADVTAVSHRGDTALSEARRAGQTEIADILKARGTSDRGDRLAVERPDR